METRCAKLEGLRDDTLLGMSESREIQLIGDAHVRPLRDDEVDEAYGVYLEAVGWLRCAGIRQWMTAMPRARFDARQDHDENFGWFVSGELAAIFSIVREVTAHWQHVLAGDEPRPWLSTLVMAAPFRGSGLGAYVVTSALKVLHAQGEPTAYLDCSDAGFLPDFYQRLGFRVLDRKSVTYASGDTYPMVLMSRNLDNLAHPAA